MLPNTFYLSAGDHGSRIAGGLRSKIIGCKVYDDRFPKYFFRHELIRIENLKGKSIICQKRRQIPGVIRVIAALGIIVAAGQGEGFAGRSSFFAGTALMNMESMEGVHAGNALGAWKARDCCSYQGPAPKWIELNVSADVRISLGPIQVGIHFPGLCQNTCNGIAVT